MRHLIVLGLVALSLPATAAERFALPRADGSLIHYSIDRPAGAPAGTLLLAQGAGCLPTAKNTNLAEVRAAFPDYLTVMVEKRGITADSAVSDGFIDCPSEYHAGHTVTQSVEDRAAVLAAIGGPRPLVLFGGSEGGLATAILSARVAPETAVILSSATGIPFDQMVLSTIPPEGQAPIAAGLAAAQADPDGTALFAGSSHRFWADIMSDIAADYMLQARTTAFLAIQGGRDASSPLAAARATADRFREEKSCNLTYWELPALDHGMADPKGKSHMPAVIAAAAAWTIAPLIPC